MLLGVCAGTASGWRTCPALSPTTAARRGWSRTLRTGSPAPAPPSPAPSASWPSSLAPTSVSRGPGMAGSVASDSREWWVGGVDRHRWRPCEWTVDLMWSYHSRVSDTGKLDDRDFWAVQSFNWQVAAIFIDTYFVSTVTSLTEHPYCYLLQQSTIYCNIYCFLLCLGCYLISWLFVCKNSRCVWERRADVCLSWISQCRTQTMKPWRGPGKNLSVIDLIMWTSQVTSDCVWARVWKLQFGDFIFTCVYIKIEIIIHFLLLLTLTCVMWSKHPFVLWDQEPASWCVFFFLYSRSSLISGKCTFFLSCSEVDGKIQIPSRVSASKLAAG